MLAGQVGGRLPGPPLPPTPAAPAAGSRHRPPRRTGHSGSASTWFTVSSNCCTSASLGTRSATSSGRALVDGQPGVDQPSACGSATARTASAISRGTVSAADSEPSRVTGQHQVRPARGHEQMPGASRCAHTPWRSPPPRRAGSAPRRCPAPRARRRRPPRSPWRRSGPRRRARRRRVQRHDQPRVVDQLPVPEHDPAGPAAPRGQAGDVVHGTPGASTAASPARRAPTAGRRPRAAHHGRGQRRDSRPATSGTRSGSFRTRCGAVVPMRTARSRAPSAPGRSPCTRYRRPPCTSFDDQRLVPAARSVRSSRTTESPRLAASRATPAPVTPHPRPATSTADPASSASVRSRRAGDSEDGHRRSP